MIKISTHCLKQENHQLLCIYSKQPKKQPHAAPNTIMMETPSLFPRDTIKTPTSVFPHAGFLLKVARVTEPMGYKACDRETESERWRKRKGGRKGERVSERRRGRSEAQ